MKSNLPCNKDLTDRARNLRKNSTLSEILLWNQIKRKQLLGLDFDRQKVIGNYIVDFYCPMLRLVIEIDGDSHDYGKLEYDLSRQQFLENLGLTVIRILDVEVKKSMPDVLEKIGAFAKYKMGLQ